MAPLSSEKNERNLKGKKCRSEKWEKERDLKEKRKGNVQNVSQSNRKTGRGGFLGTEVEDVKGQSGARKKPDSPLDRGEIMGCGKARIEETCKTQKKVDRSGNFQHADLPIINLDVIIIRIRVKKSG